MPEHLSEEWVASKPIPNFNNISMSEFYQDTISLQIQRGFPHDAAAGEGIEHGFALPGHEL